MINLKLIGYDTLGKNGNDGIRYAWKHSSSNYYVESAAFSQRSKATNDDICGYTTSVSSGCILRSMNLACKFCRTGTLLPFGERFSSEEIAKQNILMVLAHMHCNDNIGLRAKQREFAYMGQGEPGFSYSQIREAIELTNIAMDELGQTVFRHIVATSGIPEMIESYSDDLKNDYFSSKTTIHFSLHGTLNRSEVMPVDNKYSYKDSLTALSKIYDISGEKPCVGILLLKDFLPHGSSKKYSTDFDSIKQILDYLDPKLFRLSFCEFNSSPDLGTSDIYEDEMSKNVLSYAQSLGFSAKLFSSYGRDEVTACGMLGGRAPLNSASTKLSVLEQEAETLIKTAKIKFNS